MNNLHPMVLSPTAAEKREGNRGEERETIEIWIQWDRERERDRRQERVRERERERVER